MRDSEALRAQLRLAAQAFADRLFEIVEASTRPTSEAAAPRGVAIGPANEPKTDEVTRARAARAAKRAGFYARKPAGG